MENKIYKVTGDEMQEIKRTISANDSIFVVEIEGRQIRSWKDYITTIERKMRFPSSCVDSMDRYEDWITDLSWLNKDAYAVIINHAGEFLQEDPKTRKMILDIFEISVLPWWETGVERCVVDGKAKAFNVYLVD